MLGDVASVPWANTVKLGYNLVVSEAGQTLRLFEAEPFTNVAPGLVPGGHIAYVYVRQRGSYV
jgi:hypothetical protein